MENRLASNPLPGPLKPPPRRSPSPVALAAAIVLLVGGARMARAQETLSFAGGQTTVVLADGSVYGGQVVEMVPGDHLTLKLATGELKRLAWGDIKTSAASTGALPGGTPGGMAAPWSGGAGLFGMLPSAPPPDPVQIHFQANDTQASLFRSSSIMGLPTGGAIDIGDMGMWTPVCHSPCDIEVDRHNLYSVQGPRLVSSPAFTLPQGGTLTLNADMGHESTRIAGAIVDVVGVLGMTVGVSLLIVAGTVDTSSYGDPATALPRQQNAQSEQHSYLVAGFASTATGLAVLAIGISMRYLSRTSVRIPEFGRIARLMLPASGGGGPLAFHF